MRTDDGRIDHLQRGVRHSASRKPFQDHVPDATVGPPPKLPKDRVPVAEALRQVAPRCAGSHQPKHRVEHAAMIAWRPAAAAMDQKRFEVRPLIVGHQSANQGCPPQRAALNQFAILASIGLSTRPRPRVLVREKALDPIQLVSLYGCPCNEERSARPVLQDVRVGAMRRQAGGNIALAYSHHLCRVPGMPNHVDPGRVDLREINGLKRAPARAIAAFYPGQGKH